MIVEAKQYTVRGLNYIIRSAFEQDAKSLSEVRLQIDGETENMDRERGEAFIDEQGFKQVIKDDSEAAHNIFLVAEVNGRIAGFSRCAGNNLKRSAHRVEFGVGVLEAFWGYGIGKKLLEQSIQWADSNGIRKICLQVLETNEKAAELYKRYGFEVEGVLKDDKRLSDGKFYNTVVMGRVKG